MGGLPSTSESEESLFFARENSVSLLATGLSPGRSMGGINERIEERRREKERVGSQERDGVGERDS